jgi:hypothetical protein
LSDAELLDGGGDLEFRMTGDLDSLSLANLRQRADPQIVHLASTPFKFIERPSYLSALPNSQIPFLTAAAVAGMDSEFLIVGDGSTLKAFRGTEQVSTAGFSSNIFKIAVSSLDPTTFAVAGARDVAVYTIHHTGQLEQQGVLQLMLESFGGSLHVVSVDWVPLQPYHLAVTTPATVKIYDVPNDRIAPILCYQSREKITSCVFLEREDDPWLLAGTISGRVALENCQVDSRSGPLDLTHFLAFPSMQATSVFVSHAPRTGFVFVSFARRPLLVCRAETLFQSPSISNCPLIANDGHMFQESLVFVAGHPQNPSLHIFQTSHNGELFLLEFTQEGIACGPIGFAIPPVSVGDNSLLAVGGFEWQNTIGVIGVDGALAVLKPGRSHAHSPLEYSAEGKPSPSTSPDSEEDGSLFTVPASFWIYSLSDPHGYTALDGKGIDITQRLERGHYILDGAQPVLTLKSRNRSRAIVGIGITFGTSIQILTPSAIRISNRRHIVQKGAARRYNLPLKPNEVDSDGVVRIEFEGDASAVQIQDFMCYFTQWKPRSERATVDWRNSAAKLQDFVDMAEGGFETDLEFLAASLSAASIERDKGDRTAAIDLICLMYRRAAIASFCRRALLKAVDNPEELADVWAAAIHSACAEGGVDAKMVDLLWRDFQLLPPEKQKIVGQDVWKAFGGHGCVHALVVSLAVETGTSS